MMRGSNPVVLYKDSTPMNKTHASQGRYYNIGGGQYILTSDIGGTCAAIQDPGAQIIFGIVQMVFLSGKLV